MPPTNADRSAQSDDRQLSSVDPVPDGLGAQAEHAGRLGDSQQFRMLSLAGVECRGRRRARREGDGLQPRQESGECCGQALMHVHRLLAVGAVEVMRCRVAVGEVGLVAALTTQSSSIVSVVLAETLSLAIWSYGGLGLIGQVHRAPEEALHDADVCRCVNRC